MTGYQAVIGVLAALASRGVTGAGQHVEVDMLSVVMDAQVQEIVTYLNTGLKPERRDEATAHAWIPAPYGVHRTKDGWMTMAMCSIDVLGEAVGSDRLAGMVYDDGLTNADEIYRILRPILETRPTQEWIDHFDRFNIWAGPVHDYADLESDPQVVSRGLLTQVQHPEAGAVRTVDVPIRLSRHRGASGRALFLSRAHRGGAAQRPRLQRGADSSADGGGRCGPHQRAAVGAGMNAMEDGVADDILLSLDGAVATITLNKPAKLNAMSVAMDPRLNELVIDLNNDDRVRVVVLTGAGDRAFCVGSDLTDLEGYGNQLAVPQPLRPQPGLRHREEAYASPSSPPSTATASAEAWRWPVPPTSGSPRRQPASVPARSGWGWHWRIRCHPSP